MPWCEDCSKFWNPPELARGSRCPSCGEVLSAPRGGLTGLADGSEPARGGLGGGQEHAGVAPRAGAASLSGEGSRARAQVVPLVEAGQAAGDEASTGVAIRAKGAPWHFKLLVVGVAGYMVYRIIWFIEWLPKHI